MNMSQTKNNTFNATVAAHILGKKTNVSLSGSPERVGATKDVIVASKELYEALCSNNSTFELVTELLKKKNKASQRFQDIMGVPWVL